MQLGRGNRHGIGDSGLGLCMVGLVQLRPWFGTRLDMGLGLLNSWFSGRPVTAKDSSRLGAFSERKGAMTKSSKC